MPVERREICRICGDENLQIFLSLGPQPLANAFLRSRGEFRSESFYPLDVYFCRDCSLVQLLDVVDPFTLFSNYIYVTGTSETMARHNAAYARTVADLPTMSPDDLVVEIGSNDGSLLRCFGQRGMRTLGVEPASNIAKLANQSGVRTLNRFFSAAAAEEIRASGGPAKVVLANNVLAHVDEPKDFLRGCKYLLDDSGLVVVEAPDMRHLIDRLEYDTIYHEHLSYFSAPTLVRLFEEAGLRVWRVDDVSVHGGSLRVYAGKAANGGRHSEEVLRRAEAESAHGMSSLAGLESFARQVEDNRSQIRGLLHTLIGEGKTVAGYGAAAKSTVLLNYCGIALPYVVDKNPMKVDRFTPGTHIPVLPVEALLERQPDYVLLLAWNFQEEIVRQQAEYVRRGGRFIVPLPEAKIL